MSRCILKPLYCFVLVVFCSATYDLNDITGNYPYCLTASKERKPSLTKENSEKSYPFTYLEVLGSNPFENSDSKIKTLRCNENRRKDPDDGVNDSTDRVDRMNKANLGLARLVESSNPLDMDSAIDESQDTQNNQDLLEDKSHTYLSNLDDRVLTPNQNMAEVHDDLLNSNDIPLPLTGKSKTLSDHFIGTDEKRAVLRMDNANVLSDTKGDEHINRVGTVETASEVSPGKKSFLPKKLYKKAHDLVHMERFRKLTSGSHKPETAKSRDTSSLVDSRISNEKLLSESESANIEKRSANPRHIALKGDKIDQVFQDVTELDDRARGGRIFIDHNVCVEDQKGRKKNRVIEREKRMLGRKKKSRKQSKKQYQKENKKKIRKKKSKRLMKKLLKSKRKQSVKCGKEIPVQLIPNNRTRRGAPSKTILEMISVPLEKYLQDVASKKDVGTKLPFLEMTNENNRVDLTAKNHGKSYDLFIPDETEPQQNRNLFPSDVLGFANSGFLKWNSNTKKIAGQESKSVNENDKIKANIFAVKNFTKILNENPNTKSNNLLEKTPEYRAESNFHFEISDIGLKPKEHNSIVYYLNRNVALPPAHKLDDLYGTQNSMKKLDTSLNTLDNAKEEDHIKMNEFGGMNNTFTETGSCILACANLTSEHSSSTTAITTSCLTEATNENLTIEQVETTISTFNFGKFLPTTTCSNFDKAGNVNLSHQSVSTTPTLNSNKLTTMPRLTCPTTKPITVCAIKTLPTIVSVSNQNLPSINTTDCIDKMMLNKCLEEANNKKYPVSVSTTYSNRGYDSSSSVNTTLNESCKKAKRQILPSKLLPMLLENDIEQPVQNGQSKKIFLYLHQVNPKDISARAREEDSQFLSLLKSNPNIDFLAKDANSIKKLLSSNLELKFPRRKDYPSKQKSELMENKLKKRKEKCDSAITIKTCAPTHKIINNLKPTCSCIDQTDPQYTMKNSNFSQTKTSLRKLSLRTSLVDKTTASSSSSKSIGTGLYLYNPMYRYSLSAVKTTTLRTTTNMCTTTSPPIICSPVTQCPACSLTSVTTANQLTYNYSSTKSPAYALKTECPTCPTTNKCQVCATSTKCPTCPTTIKCSTCPPTSKCPTGKTSTCPTTTKCPVCQITSRIGTDKLTTTCLTTDKKSTITSSPNSLRTTSKTTSKTTTKTTFPAKTECVFRDLATAKSRTTCDTTTHHTIIKSTTTCFTEKNPTTKCITTAKPQQQKSSSQISRSMTTKSNKTPTSTKRYGTTTVCTTTNKEKFTQTNTSIKSATTCLSKTNPSTKSYTTCPSTKPTKIASSALNNTLYITTITNDTTRLTTDKCIKVILTTCKISSTTPTTGRMTAHGITKGTNINKSVATCPSTTAHLVPNSNNTSTNPPKVSRKPDCVEDSWEPAENDANCRDDSTLIEYWKEIL